MFNLSYEEIVDQIASQKGMMKTQVEEHVKKKLDSLSNLISKEGAAHIVANELGLNLFDASLKKMYKIQEIKSGMRNINLSARVMKVYEVKSFKNDSREGKVGSLFVGDETGKTRVVLWDAAHLSFLEKEMVKEGDVVQIKNAYTKENNRGFPEVHLNTNSSFEVNPPGVDVTLLEASHAVSLKDVSGLQEGDFTTVRGTVRAVYPPRMYDACSGCNKKLQEGMCPQHGATESKKALVLNFLFDDGTETIRTVAFRNAAEYLMGEDCQKLSLLSPEELQVVSERVAGEQIKMTGRVSKNAFTGKLEFAAVTIERLNPEDLAKELMEEVKVSEI